MIRRPPRSTPLYSSAASDEYKRQHAFSVVTLRPPMGSLLPGARTRRAVMGSPASVSALTSEGSSLPSLAFCSLVAAASMRAYADSPYCATRSLWICDGVLPVIARISEASRHRMMPSLSVDRTDGTVWSTDKDGIILCLLASEILAITGKTPSQIHKDLVAQYGESAYARIDAAATKEQKAKLGKLDPSDVKAETLAGEPITARLVRAPGNNEPIGGLKVTTEN